MSPNPQAPGYKEGIRLRKSTILHPTDFVKNRRLPRYRSPAVTKSQRDQLPRGLKAHLVEY